MKFLIIGAGFAGAVTARELAEAGHKVLVIDRRDHIAGNAFDVKDEYRILIHQYGPIFFIPIVSVYLIIYLNLPNGDLMNIECVA